MREEIFGPVVRVPSFDDDDLDAVARFANDPEYGLQGTIRTQNLSLAHRMARRIKAGTICINTHSYGDPAWPFGGYKQSGCGRGMGKEVMEHYTETKSVAARLQHSIQSAAAFTAEIESTRMVLSEIVPVTFTGNVGRRFAAAATSWAA